MLSSRRSRSEAQAHHFALLYCGHVAPLHDYNTPPGGHRVAAAAEKPQCTLWMAREAPRTPCRCPMVVRTDLSLSSAPILEH
jgi:hypothetical protein